MPYYVVQHGSAVSILNTAGTATAVTLPTNVTISSAFAPRFAIWDREVVLVNAVSKPVAINRDAGCRVLVPKSPASAPVISGTGSSTLTGSYSVKVSFLVKDAFGRILAESALSPASNTVSITNQYLLASNIPISAETVSARRLYRTTTGGAVYFPWVDVEGNVITSVQDSLSDAGLQLVAAPTNLGNVPDLTLICEWRGRLWGVDRQNIDILRRTGGGTSYAWDPTLEFQIPQVGGDKRGITSLLRRRDELGVARQNAFHMITGNSDSDFTRVVVAEQIGCISQESVQIIDDVAYFLGSPYGVYTWNDSGIRPISHAKVRGWFGTDTYFNRARFQYAKSAYDPIRHLYQLHLAAAGSSSEDRWIHYDIESGQWYGPHKTGEFAPSAAGLLTASDDTPLTVIGSDNGFLWKNQDTRTDGTATAIDFDVDTPFLSGETPTPDIQKQFLELAVVSAIQGSGTLTITPKVGGLDASAGTAISHDMTLGRQRLRRLGPGRFAQLNLRQNTAAVDVSLYGLELPYFELGRR